jgi:hypothetical protein
MDGGRSMPGLNVKIIGKEAVRVCTYHNRGVKPPDDVTDDLPAGLLPRQRPRPAPAPVVDTKAQEIVDLAKNPDLRDSEEDPEPQAPKHVRKVRRTKKLTMSERADQDLPEANRVELPPPKTNYDRTRSTGQMIAQLAERRDAYSAAIKALEAIALLED